MSAAIQSAMEWGPGAEPPLCLAVTTNFPESGNATEPWDKTAAWKTLLPSQKRRLEKTKERAAICSKRVVRIKHVCGKTFYVTRTCRTRLCERCCANYNAVKRKRFESVGRMHLDPSQGSLKFVTFTFNDRAIRWNDPTECKDWIRERTQMLRDFLMGPDAPKNWRVRGYLAVWEITRGTEGRYHPHLHVLVWSSYLPRAQLRALWHARTNAWNVDVSKIKNQGESAMSYVLNYVSKKWKDIPDDLVALSFFRTRRITATGEFYGGKLRKLREIATRADERSVVRLCCPSCGLPQPGPDATRREGEEWKPPGEWFTDGCPDEIPAGAEPASMMAVDWFGCELWPDVQRVQLPDLEAMA